MGYGVRMADIWAWMTQLVSTYGYFGAFIISLFGNFTVFFPVPFAITIYAFGATLNPLALGLVCGFGSTIGEFSAYIIGRGGRRIIENSYGKRLDTAKLLIQRYGMMIIFIFAVLPLPDDLILIPMGMLRYSLKKAITAMLIGKIIMCTSVAYAGYFSYSFIRDIFSESGIIGGVLSTIVLAVIIIALIKVDWTKYIEVPPEKS
jgi:membrane protein DedA with SNARE-associated domain